MSTVVTGLLFALILTRMLNPEEFGTWNLIISFISYSLVIEPVISYWTTRDIARGEKAGKTALLSSGMFSFGGSLIYLMVVFLLTKQSTVQEDIIFLSIILVPIMFLKGTLYAINMGWKPQVSSYSLLVSEVAKVPLGLFFIFILDMGIQGVLITFVIANLLSIFVLSYLAKEKIRNELKIRFLKKWVKNSWFSLYLSIGSMVMRLDVFIFVVVIDSVVGIAIFSASMIVSSINGHAGLVSSSTYPKLLSEEKGNYLQSNLTRFFYFSIPLTMISIFFAKAALYALNPFYAVTTIIVLFLTLRVFLNSINIVFTGFIYGIDKVDKNYNSKINDYFKSNMFKITFAKFIMVFGYLISLTVGLVIFRETLDDVQLVIFWAIISFLAYTPYTVYLGLVVRKNFKIKLEYTSIFKYILASIIQKN